MAQKTFDWNDRYDLLEGGCTTRNEIDGLLFDRPLSVVSDLEKHYYDKMKSLVHPENSQKPYSPLWLELNCLAGIEKKMINSDNEFTEMLADFHSETEDETIFDNGSYIEKLKPLSNYLTGLRNENQTHYINQMRNFSNKLVEAFEKDQETEEITINSVVRLVASIEKLTHYYKKVDRLLDDLCNDE